MDFKASIKSAAQKIWSEFGVSIAVAFLWVFAGLNLVKFSSVFYSNVVNGWMFSTSEIVVIGSSIVWAAFFSYLADEIRHKYPVGPKKIESKQ